MSPRWEPNPNIRKGRRVVYSLRAHLVFTPKYRRGPFTDEILTRCEEIMRAVCADFATELVEFNGDADHVHPLVHYPPKVAISRLVGSLKGVSARRLRQEFPGHIRK
ncbi:IS200/IS605 family transposase, partial [Streptomyces mirabilis]|uniref:IS200/IS605 family transposase n=1 Tax=Streptomyces mirabilis TaxID=68239 RepID=UPI003647DA53